MKRLATFCAGIFFFISGLTASAHGQEAPAAPEKDAHPGAAAPAPRATPQPQAMPHQEAAPHPQPSPHPQAQPQPGARPQQEAPAGPPVRNSHEEITPSHPPQTFPPQPQQHKQSAPPEQQAHPPEHNPAPRPPVPEQQAHPATQPPAAQPPSSRAQRQPRPEQSAVAPSPAQQAEWQQHRASNWQAEHRTWQQRGGYTGYRIPDDRYRAEFGRAHTFRIYQYPVAFVGGYPRFQYGGCWVQLVDPWPQFWGPNWYDTDDVYLDYWNDGYYLFNPRYPGVPVAVEILPC